MVGSAKTGGTWRLVSDEGPYLNGHDAAPCPLAFFSVGMVASYVNEIIALAELESVAIRNLRLILNNFYSMTGSMPRRTMVGGAEPVELAVEIDCDLDTLPLNSLLMRAIQASPVNGLVNGRLENIFKLANHGRAMRTERATELDNAILPDPVESFDTAQAEASSLTLMEPCGKTPKRMWRSEHRPAAPH